MSKPKFTPGPWEARVTRYFGVKDDEQEVVVGTALDSICRLTGSKGSTQEAMPDATLIALAPDLYDFIATLENDDGKIPAWLWEKRNALLAKARGEQP